MSLVEELSNKGYHVYVDNYYTSPALFLDLLENGFEGCGTVRCDRKGLSKTFQNANLCKGTSFVYKYNKSHYTNYLGEVYSETIANNKLTCLKWRDKRVVHMLSTFHDDSMTSKRTEELKVGKRI